jgi:hypothetical protein
MMHVKRWADRCSMSWQVALRDLLIEAIRYGEQPEVRARLTRAMSNALEKEQIRDLLEEHALVHDAMDATRVQRIREDMERAEARRFISSRSSWQRSNGWAAR